MLCTNSVYFLFITNLSYRILQYNLLLSIILTYHRMILYNKTAKYI